MARGTGAEGDVEQHDIEVVLDRVGDRGVTVGDGRDPVPLPLERAGEHLA